MIEAFITKHGGIYHFKHITYVRTEKDDIILYIKTITSTQLIELTFTSVENRNQQLYNFMQYLTKSEPTTTELS